MKTKIEFEIQVATTANRHGWKAIGGREGRLYLSEEDYVETRGRDAVKLQKAIERIRRDERDNWMKPRALRIVKVTTVVTYETVVTFDVE